MCTQAAGPQLLAPGGGDYRDEFGASWLWGLFCEKDVRGSGFLGQDAHRVIS